MRTERRTTLKRKVMIAVATGLMAVGAASPAFAAYEQVGGGEWWYGVAAGENFSYYDHPSRNHGSSVQNSYGTVRSACEPPNMVSIAEQPEANSGNKAFWRHC